MTDIKTINRNLEQRQNEQRRPMRRARAQNDDRHYIDPGLIPHGMDWQWNRYSILGQIDQDNLIAMQEDGWSPVTWGHLPEIKRPPGITDKGLKEPVIKGGLMLMQRPMELTQEARAEDRERASEQVNQKLAEIGQAPPETMTRVHKKLDNFVRREFAPIGMPVPENE